LVVTVLVTVLGPVSGRAAAAAAPVAKDAVTLLGQSTWVGTNGVFSLHLGVAAAVPATDTIVVTAYARLTTRTNFDQFADGRLGDDITVWTGQESVGDAPPAPHGGGVLARIPVEAASGPGDLATPSPFAPGSLSGVYPLRIQIFGPDYAAVGRAIPTFLVYDAAQSAFPKLSASITVPIDATPSVSAALAPTALAPATSSTLSTLTSVLAAAPDVPLTLAVAPQTAEALSSGSAADRATLARTAALVRGGDEVLSEPYAPVSLATLVSSGLDDQIGPQLREGSAVLAATLGTAPSASTWVADEPVDGAVLRQLQHDGLRRIVLADGALSPLPATLTRFTYGYPTDLADGAGSALRVFAADPVLSGRVTQATTPVLAAEQTLAELAMIELENPADVRGVAFSLPSGAALSPTYLATLLHGLQGNPFVRAVTAAGLFAAVPPAPAPQRTAVTPVPVRSLRPTAAPAVPEAPTLQALEVEIRGVTSLLPADTTLIDRLRRELLIAPSPGLDRSRLLTLLGAMNTAVDKAESSVRLPGDTSVTVTSLKATLPLTVLSTATLSPHVRLVLDSPKLDFRPFRPPHGTCRVIDRSTEICDMVLHGPQTPLRVPVEARTSGVFSLDVVVMTPDDSLTLAHARDTVRSTAVSSVGIVIIVLSLLFLGIWWIRDIRSGRRARQLMRRPGDDIDDDPGDDPPGGDIGPPPPRPDGPAEPAEPHRTPAPPVTVGRLGAPVGARGRDAPTARRELSPSKGAIGLNLGAVTEPRERHAWNPCCH
jgi:hypothetical protein